MIGLAYVYGILGGLALGISIAMLFTIWIVKKSNDIGDSKGQFGDFSEYLDVICDDDDLRQVY